MNTIILEKVKYIHIVISVLIAPRKIMCIELVICRTYDMEDLFSRAYKRSVIFLLISAYAQISSQMLYSQVSIKMLDKR